MNGSYNITVRDKNSEYNFTIHKKYTLLTGDSATGKSKLYKMLKNPETEIKVVSTNENADILSLDSRKDIYLRYLPCKEPTIYVIDDNTQDYLDIEFKDLMNKSNAYFVIISRKKLVYKRSSKDGTLNYECLPLSETETYRISTEIKHNSKNGSEYYSNTFTRI